MGFDYRISTGLGKWTLGGYKQNLVCTRSQEKGTVYPQDTEPDLSVSVQQSLAEVWGDHGLMHWSGSLTNAGSGVLNTTVGAQVLLKEVAIIFI